MLNNEMYFKQLVAEDNKYPSWPDMYNWIARAGEQPHVVALLIEKITAEYYQIAIEQYDRYNEIQRQASDQLVDFNTFLILDAPKYKFYG